MDDECDCRASIFPARGSITWPVADKPSLSNRLHPRSAPIKQEHILMAMMAIKGIYAEHQAQSLNHGIGFNTAAIESAVAAYGEQLGLKESVTLDPD